ncbi:MAG: hormogonium polysaccharide secretion pseudopilin HpsB [Spirulinaceae cyanobacterium]
MKNRSFFKPKPTTSESGFTIIESLLGILIITIMLVGIAPVLTLAVANRVQAKRVEAASQAAQGYIDSVRSGRISHPQKNATTFEMRSDALSDQPVPQKGALDCPTASAYCTGPTINLFCVDGDDDGECTANSAKDLIVQGFGYIPNDDSTVNTRSYYSYKLGVRVYRADGFSAGGAFTKASDNNRTSGQQKTFGAMALNTPLFEQAAEIAVEDGEFSDLCRDAGLSANECN